MLKFLNMPVCRHGEAGGLVCILLASLFATALAAQTGEVDIDTTYFHPAASLYIHGDATGASNLVAKGLSVFPDDGKLLRLKDLLEQQQEQQQNEDNQQQDDQQQDQQDQQDDQQQDQQQDQSEEQSQQPEPPSAEQMSADEAEQLLDAMRQEEQNKRLQLHPVLGAPVNVEKDW